MGISSVEAEGAGMSPGEAADVDNDKPLAATQLPSH
jgi:hypothetical protein